jgi:hypothetical protein
MIPATELVKMTDPPWPRSTIGGTAAFTVFQSPVRLMSIMSCHISSVRSNAGAKADDAKQRSVRYRLVFDRESF